MKYLQTFCSICCLMLIHSCQPKEIPAELTQIIDDIKMQYALDKRVAIWEVSAKRGAKGIQIEGETNIDAALEDFKNRLEDSNITAALNIRILPDEQVGDYIYGIVNLSVCNIRSKPTHSAELATQSTFGTILKVYKEQDGWFLVQTPDAYLGWLDAAGFQKANKTDVAIWKDSSKIVYLPDYGFSYESTSTSAGIVSDLVAGNILRFSGYEGDFAIVEYPDGRTACIPAQEVLDYEEWINEPQPTAEQLLVTARSFIGRPYLWGGTSGKGVDCSGFTKTIFYLNGILLPRDASQQVHAGMPVETDTTLSNLKTGDLLFFGRKATEDKKERITHVAMYIGDGKIIHSAGSVKIESMRRGEPGFSENRLQSFIRAKRMLPADAEHGIYSLRRLTEFY